MSDYVPMYGSSGFTPSGKDFDFEPPTSAQIPVQSRTEVPQDAAEFMTGLSTPSSATSRSVSITESAWPISMRSGSTPTRSESVIRIRGMCGEIRCENT